MIQDTLKLADLPYAEITVKAPACNERPHRRLEAFGPGPLSDTELLTLALQGRPRDGGAVSVGLIYATV